jgi:hypothetical protein
MAQDLFAAVANRATEKSTDTATRSVAKQCRRSGQMEYGVVATLAFDGPADLFRECRRTVCFAERRATAAS